MVGVKWIKFGSISEYVLFNRDAEGNVRIYIREKAVKETHNKPTYSEFTLTLQQAEALKLWL
jgi:hypothetical protein